jgi:hypothetical protein
MRLIARPDFSLAGIFFDNVLKMILQGLDIIRFLHALQDFHDDGCKAVLVEPDFLVVGNLADVADVCEGGGEGGRDGAAEEGDGAVGRHCD